MLSHRTLHYLAFAFVLLLPAGAYAEWNFLESISVHPEFHGPVPKKSDVIFSTRFKRDNAPAVAKAFGATRIEWVYSTDEVFVESLKKVAPWYGGTLSSSMPLPGDQGIARDFDGKPIVAPWMKSWGAKWITTTDPRTREVLKSTARRYLQIGANSIQIDDWRLQYAATDWGGDFSEASLAGFRDFLKTYPDRANLQRMGITELQDFNYRNFLAETYGIRTAKDYQARFRSLPTTPLWLDYFKRSVISHFLDLRDFLNSEKGAVVPVSFNLFGFYGPDERRPEFDILRFVDYSLVETKIDDLDTVLLQAATYRSLGLGYVPSILPKSKEDNRSAIAFLYAVGAQPLVPWDVAINDTRFFGDPDDYADLYRFVRVNKNLFDDYESAAVVGLVVSVQKYRQAETLDLVKRLSHANIPFALVLVGGTKLKFSLAPATVGKYKLLITPNAMSDFDATDAAILHAMPVKLVQAQQVSGQDLESLSLLIDPGKPGLRVIPRASKATPNKLLLHVLRPHTQDLGNITKCEHSVGLRNDIVHGYNLEAVWHSPSVAATPVASVNDPHGILFNLQGCEEWGVMEITVKNSK